eukprot:PhF_6_TR7949/c0_g1_i1/m.11988
MTEAITIRVVTLRIIWVGRWPLTATQRGPSGSGAVPGVWNVTVASLQAGVTALAQANAPQAPSTESPTIGSVPGTVGAIKASMVPRSAIVSSVTSGLTARGNSWRLVMVWETQGVRSTNSAWWTGWLAPLTPARPSVGSVRTTEQRRSTVFDLTRNTLCRIQTGVGT